MNRSNPKLPSQSPELMSQSLIKEKGIIEATYSVQSKLVECRNYSQEVYWTNVLSLLRKAW